MEIVSIQHGGSCSLLKVSYATFRYAVLKVSIHAAVREALPIHLAILDECVIRKMSIVGVEVNDLYATLFGRSFEGVLGHDCFLAGNAFLQVDKCILLKLVNENVGILVPLLHEGSFELCYEPGCRRLQWVHRHYLSWVRDCLACPFVVSLDSPGPLRHLAVLASGAKGRVTGKHAIRELPLVGQLFNAVKRQVPKAIMPP